MKIKASKKLTAYAVHAAICLNVYNFDLKIRRTNDSSSCTINSDGSFLIEIEQGIGRTNVIRHIAHEMTHLRQMKHGELSLDELGNRRWKGEIYPHYPDHSDEYFLSPWEMEARAMEDFILFKWENRCELH